MADSVIVVSQPQPATVITANTGQTVVTGTVAQAAQVVNVAEQGPTGPSGPPGTSIDNAIQATAAQTISANTAVALVNGQLVPAQSGVASQAGNVLGIAQNGGPAGTLVNVQFAGTMTMSSWNWTMGQPIFVGPNGPLTQTAPTAGFSQVVGVPLSSTTMSIGFQPPILIA